MTDHRCEDCGRRHTGHTPIGLYLWQSLRFLCMACLSERRERGQKWERQK